jgi:hypothetical protein
VSQFLLLRRAHQVHGNDASLRVEKVGGQNAQHLIELTGGSVYPLCI